MYVGAFDKEELIGSQAAIPLNFIGPEGKKLLTAKSEDTLLDPRYRGKGLFEKMYEVLFKECRSRGVVCIWGFTYAKKPFLKIGFQIPFDTLSGVFVIHPLKAYSYLVSLNTANKLKEKLLIFLMTSFSYFKTVFRSRSVLEKDHKLGKFSSNEKLIENIANTNNLFLIQQSKSYLDWRIIRNPYDNKYLEFIKEDEKGEIIASIIVNIRKGGLAYLEQIHFNSNLKYSVKLNLLKVALNYLLKHNEVNLIRFWGFKTNNINQEELSLLEDCGFFFVKKGTGFVYISLIDSAPDANSILLSRLYTQGNI
ncbi:MAG: GNAT family N-acetyltransferase [Bacteroidetes bacterium]|nr:GNAT family N-acetyltransferase [Bacteroidota bacterium]